MDRSSVRYERQTYAVMRGVTGFLFSCHGGQKVFGLFDGSDAPLFSLHGVAGLIELVCGLFMGIGFFTGCAAFLSSGLMAVAYFMVHFSKGFWPIQNRGELAAVYCFVFLYMAVRGSGVWSLDSAFQKRKNSTLITLNERRSVASEM